MHATAAVSIHPVAATATGEAIGQLLDAGIEQLNLVCCFVTSAHAGALEDIVATLGSLLSPDVVLGAAAAGVVGPDAVIDKGPGLVLWGAAAGPVSPLQVNRGAPLALPEGARGALLLADPASLLEDGIPDAGGWLDGVGDAEVCATLVAPARAAGGSVLAVNGSVQRQGAVGVALGGGVDLRAVVCPGTRPVGPTLLVTRGEGPIIYELDGVAARVRLDRLARHELPATEIAFINRGLALAVAGDTAVYPVAGADPDNGAIVLGAGAPDPSIEVTVGTRVRFHVRDDNAQATAVERALHTPPATSALIFPSGLPPLNGLEIPVGGCRGAAALRVAAEGSSPQRIGSHRTTVHRGSAAVACFYDITSPSGGQQPTLR